MNTVCGNDVERMAVELTGDQGAVAGIRKHLLDTQLVWTLIQMRNASRMNQKQLAQKMGVSTSKVSRMEAVADDDLSFGDIRAYTKALGMDISIMFDSAGMPAAQRIKQHVLAIHDLLETLCEISKEVGGGDDISRKIKDFYGDVLFNLLLVFAKNYSSLPSCEPLQFPAQDVPQVVAPHSEPLTSTPDSRL